VSRGRATSSEPAAPADDAARAAALVAGFAELGVVCAVEAHGRLAVVVPTDADAAVPDAGLRRRMAALAERHGFTHLALDLDPVAHRATLRRA
jgi:hypothetical protein